MLGGMTVTMHKIIALFFKVNNSVCLGVNIVAMRSVSADLKYFLNR